VRNHLSSAIGKTGASNRAEAVFAADRHGWL
jgi:two-component system response regulator DesR